MSRTNNMIFWLYRILRLILGSIFVYSGFIKMADPKGFARLISQYDLVPDLLLVPVALGLPALELLAGIGLMFEIPAALSLISGLLIMFIFILWYGMMKNLDVDCGCFSTEELDGQKGLVQAFYRDLVMLAVCLYLYLYRYLQIRSGQSITVWSKIRKII